MKAQFMKMFLVMIIGAGLASCSSQSDNAALSDGSATNTDNVAAATNELQGAELIEDIEQPQLQSAGEAVLAETDKTQNEEQARPQSQPEVAVQPTPSAADTAAAPAFVEVEQTALAATEPKAFEPQAEPEAAPKDEATEATGNIGEYKVKQSETLMWIAFKLYGDYTKWKQLAALNSSHLTQGSSVKKGTVLKYEVPAEEFAWKPEGQPYLIKRNETLGIISNNVYETPKRWKSIWDNNRAMIKNPNKIFAGFTLYYIPDTRKVASETKTE